MSAVVIGKEWGGTDGSTALGEARVATRELEMLLMAVFARPDVRRHASEVVKRLQRAVAHASRFERFLDEQVRQADERDAAAVKPKRVRRRASPGGKR